MLDRIFFAGAPISVRLTSAEPEPEPEPEPERLAAQGV
jgi:hypothetical protein